MVFLVRGTLTEEDRAGWRRLAAQRERTARKKRRREVLSWLGDKFCGLICVLMGAVMLYAIVSGGASAWYLLCAPFMLIGGVLVLVIQRHCPAGEVERLSGEDSPLPDPVRAAFFGDGCFAFWDASGKVRLGYSAIAAAWEDEGRIYLFFRDRPPLVLPKRGFAGGTAEDFRDFLERELGFPSERIK